MTGRRVAALAAAVVLVAGAWLVRTRVIEDDDDAVAMREVSELVCARDFESVCARLAADGIDTVVEDASDTLERLRDVPVDELPLWLTVDPSPAMLDSLRGAARQDPAGWSTIELASSPIALVSPQAKADALAVECPDPGRWRCLGDLAGAAWADVAPSLAGDVRPAFAPPERYAAGLVALGQATAGWFDDAPVDINDPGYFAWLRALTGQVSTRSLSGGTPIRTILTRASALDVAVGVEAELGASPDPRFGVTYAAPMTTADVVLAAPAGVDVPEALARDLTARLSGDGWDAPTDGPSGALAPSTLLALEALWGDISR